MVYKIISCDNNPFGSRSGKYYKQEKLEKKVEVNSVENIKVTLRKLCVTLLFL